MHTTIVTRQREEFDELVRRKQAQVRVLREEAANVSNRLAVQLAAERNKCHELEVVAEFQLKASNQEYVGEVQKLCAAKDALAEELNLTHAALAMCQQEITLRGVILQSGDAQTGNSGESSVS